MKNIILLIALMICIKSVYAGSTASIFNGNHYNLKGRLMIQDADNPDEFYFLPKKFKLKTQSELATDSHGRQFIQNKQMINHSIITNSEGNKYSRYDLRVRLESLSRSKKMLVTSKLRRLYGRGAKLKGRVPMCGIATDLMKSIGGNNSQVETIKIIFGFVEDDLATCSNFNAPDSFLISIIVPMNYEPAFAQSLVNGVGAIMPTIKIAHPYKFKDKASLNINVAKFYKQVTKGGSLKGSYMGVKAGVSATVKKAIQTLQYTGAIHFDIQHQDPQVRAHFETTFINLISKHFFSITASPDLTLPPANGGAHKPITFANQGGKGASPTVVEASFNYSKEEAEQMGNINFSLEKVNYGAMQSHTTIEIPRINKEHIAPEIRDQLRVE